MNGILATGGTAMLVASLAACSGAYPDGNSYAALIHNPSAPPRPSASVPALPTQSCPGSNESGDYWHPGGYCLTGGRS